MNPTDSTVRQGTKPLDPRSRRLARWWGLALGCATALSAVPEAQHAGGVRHLARRATVTVTNLGLDAHGIGDANVAGDTIVFKVSEQGQGSTDLDGDGDVSGPVNFVHDAVSRTTTNLMIAGANGGSEAAETAIVLQVSETLAGRVDLNGDGDTNDAFVPHAYDVTTGTLLDLGYESTQLHVAGRLAAIAPREGPNGFVDYNGDGDASDSIAFVYDFDTGVTTNLGVPAGTMEVTPHMVVLESGEAGQGHTDLNGDGDASDVVLHVHHRASGLTENVGLALAPGYRVADPWIAFEVSEGDHFGADLNGDGDANDRVMHVYDRTAGTATNLALATQDGYFGLSDEAMAVEVSEAAQGADLNGDGDMSDYVISVTELETMTSTNLALASLGYGGDPLAGEGVVAFVVDEAQDGGTDHNGDGDANDVVLHVHDVETGTTTNLGYATRTPSIPTEAFRIGDGLVAFAVRESEHFGLDLNGDGDALDDVLHHYDIATGATTNLGLAVRDFGVHYFHVAEADQGGTDLNGDGDASDYVWHAHVGDGVALNLGLARTPSSSSLVDRRTTAFRVGEAAQGNTDLNGDGDTLDDVLFVARKGIRARRVARR